MRLRMVGWDNVEGLDRVVVGNYSRIYRNFM